MKKDVLAKVSNLTRLKTAFTELGAQDKRVQERMGLLIGETGWGKTTAVAAVAVANKAIYLEAQPTWTPTALLSDLSRALGLPQLSRSHGMLQAAISQLQLSGRAVIVDEANRIFDLQTAREALRLCEVLRAVHDGSRVPVWLVGLESLAHTLAHPKHEQTNSRIARRIRFLPASLADAQALARELCEVQIAEDLLQKIWQQSGGSIRLLVVALEGIEAAAKRQGAGVADLGLWHMQQQVRQRSQDEGLVDLLGYRQQREGANEQSG